MNKQAAKEWLEKSWHNLSTAKLLYDAKHYEDVIAVEIHYSIEKSLKAFLAYENKKILRTHDLVEIAKEIINYIDLTDEFYLLKNIAKYHIEESYPAFTRTLPTREVLNEAIIFGNSLFINICKILDIDKEELK